MGSVMNDDFIFLEENSPRDGIQNESTPFSLEERVALINALSQCGFPRIQIGSFVNPRLVPQMADTEEVFRRIIHYEGVKYSALVLSLKGLEKAIGSGLEHISVFTSASETHSRKNTNRGIEESARDTVEMVYRAKSAGVDLQAGIMSAFGCRFEGVVPLRRVLEIVQMLVETGADEICLADTSGVANPLQVEEMVRILLDSISIPIRLHFHDTYGFGLANVFAGWKAGVRSFDASCGGLGGCPFIPGAAGNVATEDVVNLFQTMGKKTGISLPLLIEPVKMLEAKLKRPLPGRYIHSIIF